MANVQQLQQQSIKEPTDQVKSDINIGNTHLPQPYSDFTQLTDSSQAEAQCEAEEYTQLQKHGLDSIAEKMERLVWLESEVDECAKELEKCVKRDVKSESSTRHRLENEESKVMEMAEALVSTQQLDRAAEEAKRNLLNLKRIQASQLAEEIVAEQVIPALSKAHNTKSIYITSGTPQSCRRTALPSVTGRGRVGQAESGYALRENDQQPK